MALALYRLHRRDCKAGHSEEHRSSEYDEKKKGWKRCECPIFISGTLQGTFERQSTSKWEWDQARPQSRITIASAVKVFLSNREGAKIGPSTLRKYRTFTNQLTAFADGLGYVVLDELTSGDN
jgi:hypothetical protein